MSGVFTYRHTLYTLDCAIEHSHSSSRSGRSGARATMHSFCLHPRTRTRARLFVPRCAISFKNQTILSWYSHPLGFNTIIDIVGSSSQSCSRRDHEWPLYFPESLSLILSRQTKVSYTQPLEQWPLMTLARERARVVAQGAGK